MLFYRLYIMFVCAQPMKEEEISLKLLMSVNKII